MHTHIYLHENYYNSIEQAFFFLHLAGLADQVNIDAMVDLKNLLVWAAAVSQELEQVVWRPEGCWFHQFSGYS